MALDVGDYMVGTHRSHGHPIGKGAKLDRLMAELLARETGVNKGKGGSMHLADFSVGSLGETSILGSGPPVAVGYLAKFSSVHASVHNHFSQERHLASRAIYNQRRAGGVAVSPGLKAGRVWAQFGRLETGWRWTDSTATRSPKTLGQTDAST
jgi:hypothetical protein